MGGVDHGVRGGKEKKEKKRIEEREGKNEMNFKIINSEFIAHRVFMKKV